MRGIPGVGRRRIHHRLDDLVAGHWLDAGFLAGELDLVIGARAGLRWLGWLTAGRLSRGGNLGLAGGKPRLVLGLLGERQGP